MEGSESANGVRHRSVEETNGNQSKISEEIDEHHPFFYTMYPTTLDKIVFLLGVPTWMPLKFLITFSCVAVAWVFASLAVFRWPVRSEKPLSGWRKLFKQIAAFICRIAWTCAGMVQTVKGHQASSKEAPVIVMGPHSSFVDTLGGAVCGFPGVVSAIDNAHIPLIGTLFRVNESVFVERGDPDSRKKTAMEVRRRAEAGGTWPQLVVFPEGFCTNRRALPPYKAGAFLAGVPVQPVVIRYPNRIDTTTWVNSGPGIGAMITLLLLTPITRFELEYLPVYKPSDEEIADAQLYMNNVRDYMSRSIGIPQTDLDYSDLSNLVRTTRSKRGIFDFWSEVITKGYVEMPSREDLVKFTVDRKTSTPLILNTSTQPSTSDKTL